MQHYGGIIEILTTQGWHRVLMKCRMLTDSSTEPWSSITSTCTPLKIVLENAGMDVDEIPSEFKEMVVYTNQILSFY